jgi:transposase
MDDIKSYPLDHHGIVAGMCDELEIVERINKRIGSSDLRRIIQPGVSVKAMIINGLGFVNRCLYLTTQFFASKPVEALLGEGVRAEDLDDHTLGKTLDEIYAYGCTKFFGEIAFEIAQEKGLLGTTAKLDSTSFSFEGDYRSKNKFSKRSLETSQENEEPAAIEVTYGFSKDKRPDLKQVMLSMVVSGKADLPLWCKGLDGNSSDKKTFHEIIKAVKNFQKELKNQDSFIWIADSALYSKEALLSIQDHLWITRVPESLSECKAEINKVCDEEIWTKGDNGYSFRETTTSYGGIEQRWLIVRSDQALEREIKTLRATILKEYERATKDLWHLKNKVFECKKDAETHLKIFKKNYKFHKIEGQIIETRQHKTKGRPKKGEENYVLRYNVEAIAVLDVEKEKQAINRKGKFVLATNELSQKHLSSLCILTNYKDQQSVERGFRFLKDPYFMADHFFLKKPERIEALMVVMCLSLLVYNFAQYKVRQTLAIQKETLPNQKNKQINNPTMRWIFQMMEGVGVVEIYDPKKNFRKLMVTNLDSNRLKIIQLCGPYVMKIYKTHL